MAFVIVVNHTTTPNVTGTVQIGNEIAAFGPLQANTGTQQIEINGSRQPSPILVNTGGGQARSRQAYTFEQFGAVVLEITQNRYVNFFVTPGANENAPIR